MIIYRRPIQRNVKSFHVRPSILLKYRQRGWSVFFFKSCQQDFKTTNSQKKPFKNILAPHGLIKPNALRGMILRNIPLNRRTMNNHKGSYKFYYVFPAAWFTTSAHLYVCLQYETCSDGLYQLHLEIPSSRKKRLKRRNFFHG